MVKPEEDKKTIVEFGCFMVFFCGIIIVLLSVIFGTLGRDMLYSQHRQDVCRVMSVTAEDYINCNSMLWEDIIKQLSKEIKERR